MIIRVPKNNLEMFYHMYNCRKAYNTRMGRSYLNGL